MTKVIKNFSNKLVNMELDSKNPAQQNIGVFNPQFRKQPLKIFRGREEIRTKFRHHYIYRHHLHSLMRMIKNKLKIIYLLFIWKMMRKKKNVKKNVLKLRCLLTKKRWMSIVKNSHILCNHSCIRSMI